MKKINWKSLVITCLVTVIPMLIGIVFYNQLPERIPVHFNIYNQPDNYASKGLALFGIPGTLLAIQIILCLLMDLKRKENEEISKVESVMRWWIPILSVMVGVLLVEYPLKIRLDIRMYICAILGVLFIVTGRYFPEMNYESANGKFRPYPRSEENYKKLTKLLDYTFTIFGIMIVLSMGFNPITTVVVIIAWVLVILIETLYLGFKK